MGAQKIFFFDNYSYTSTIPIKNDGIINSCIDWHFGLELV